MPMFHFGPRAWVRAERERLSALRFEHIGVASLGATVHRSAEGAMLSVAARTPREANEALGALLAAGIDLADFSLGSPSLDEVFFALTGKPQS